MVMKSILIQLGLIILAGSLTAQDFDLNWVSGRVVNIDARPVPYAHVVLLRELSGTVTGEDGRFHLWLKTGDTLIVSHMGYTTRVFTVAGAASVYRDYLEIKLLEKVYDLKEVVVRPPFPATWEEFKHAFRNTRTDPGPQVADLSLAKEGTLQYTLPENGAGPIVQGPVTAIYNLFSREAKSRKKLMALQAADKKYNTGTRGYNVNLVRRLTGITDEETLRKFMDFCHLDPDFVSHSTDYDLYLAILECYAVFRSKT